MGRGSYLARTSGGYKRPSKSSGSSKYSGRHSGSGSAKGSKFKSNKRRTSTCR